MAAKKSATLAFTRQYLRKKPEASFAEIRDAAAEKDLKIYPIVFGRAKALEGLVKVAPYGSKKKAREAKKAEAAAEMSAGSEEAIPADKTAGAAPSGALESIDALIAGMRENHDERARYRAALIKISEILDAILEPVDDK